MVDAVFVPDMTHALRDLKELTSLYALRGLDLPERLRRLTDAGTPLFRANIDDVTAIRAGNMLTFLHFGQGTSILT